MKDIAILKQYIANISKYPRISTIEEIEFANKIKNGDYTALNSLINANLKLVVKISLELCKGSSSIMDVIQNGNLGLIKAAKKFDANRGVKFSTYAAFWIKQSILRGFIKPNLGISISYRKDEINKKIKNYVREFFAGSGKLPSIDEIVVDLNVKRRDAIDVIILFKNNGDFLANSGIFDSNEDIVDNIQDNTYNPEKVIEEKTLSSDVLKAIDSFPSRESDIIKKRYGFSCDEKETLHDLGNKYSISAEATRQIERRVLALIRTKFPSLAYYYYSL